MPPFTYLARTIRAVKAQVSSSQAFKLSLSLALLVLCVLFAADLFSLRGNPMLERQNARKVVAESLAVQLSTLVSISEDAALRFAITEFVLRNDDVLAAAMYPARGSVLAQSGQTELLRSQDSGRSTSSNMSVPLYEGKKLWGEVKLAFKPVRNWTADAMYFGFLAIGCLLAFVFFLRRVLLQLDPSRAVPGRVNSAFNLFTEGVVIMDDKLQILLTNNSATDMIDQTPDSQVGRSLDDWPWVRDENWYSPWRDALKTGVGGSDHHLYLESSDGKRLVVVGCTLVGEQEADRTGVMVTLNDMSALQQKNYELSATLQQLEESKHAIAEKNIELETLASTDPLSGLMNRRSFMERFEALHAHSIDQGEVLICVMLDIDHFKQINDTHGHSVGDDVICAVAKSLQTCARETDLVARYGGEEFVMVLPDTTMEQALVLAERLRSAICLLADDDALPLEKLSTSIGVSDLQPEGEHRSVDTMLDFADKALYGAKESGRNRVVHYDPDTLEALSASSSDSGEHEHESQAADELAAQSSGQLLESAATGEMPALPEQWVQSIIDKHNQELEMLKSHDPVTHLPKRQLFVQAIDNEICRCQRTESIMAVVSIEINDMNRFSASLGHSKSQKMTGLILEHVKDGLRVSDQVAPVDNDNNLSHLADNQFGVLLSDIADIDHMLPVLTRIRRLLQDPIVIDDQNIYPGFNMGIAIYPDCGATAAELLESASDARLKASELPEKVTYYFASSDFADKSKAYLALESDLHEAVAQRSLQVYFQPKYDLEKGCITGAEALVRWFHPIRGYVAPDDFIPMAETNGLIRKIFTQVLEISLAQLVQWDNAGVAPMNMAVNLSGAQLRDKRLVDSVLTALSKASLDPSRLELELTETTIIQSPKQARAILNTLSDHGVSVSMDDFGTGYTSLGLLAELPLACVKIDRSFINGVYQSDRTHAIVESVIRMSHALGLRVVAEGVETMEQFKALSELGCDEIQGYLISRPVPGDEFQEFLLTDSVWTRSASINRKAG